MKANLTPQEKQSMIEMVQGLNDETLAILWKTITTNSGGVSGMDPDLLKVFYDEFSKRPGLLESMTNESKKKNKMKLTEPQLRKTIREIIVEANNDRHDHVHNGIRNQHGDLDSADTDFHDYGAVSHNMISKGVWPKMSLELKQAGDWQFYDCGDGYRFIHQCMACKDEEGRIMMAIFCRDRQNSSNATATSYDCYVLDCVLIEEKADMEDPKSHWSDFAPKGEYCVNTKQIVDTLEEAYDQYIARWVE